MELRILVQLGERRLCLLHTVTRRSYHRLHDTNERAPFFLQPAALQTSKLVLPHEILVLSRPTQQVTQSTSPNTVEPHTFQIENVTKLASEHAGKR
jgi:hypothetical protein